MNSFSNISGFDSSEASKYDSEFGEYILCVILHTHVILILIDYSVALVLQFVFCYFTIRADVATEQRKIIK